MSTRTLTAAALAAAVLAGPALLPGVAVAASGSGWAAAAPVPGLAALNAGGSAGVTSVSCPASGACSAGGDYTDGSGNGQAFVVTETGGIWGTAEKVPGLAKLEGSTGNASIAAVSCGSPGDCAAGGLYLNSAGFAEAFLVSETGGTWGNAIGVPGLAALNTGDDAGLVTVSCAPGVTGNCSAGGFFSTGSYSTHFPTPFVVSETGGTWQQARQLAGTSGSLPGNGVQSVSCPAPGTCIAAGVRGRSGPIAFVAAERGGVWGRATVLPGLAALGGVAGPDSTANSVSCPAPGDCAVTGWYYDPVTHNDEAFADSSRSGVWQRAAEIPGIALLDGGDGSAGVTVSCARAGSCAVGGSYQAAISEGFVADDVNGTWASARRLPGLSRLDAGHHAEVVSVSCAAAGRCTAGGYYSPARTGSAEAGFVAGQSGGSWGRAEQVPGLAALNTGNLAEVASVSCPPAGRCALGGYYTQSGGARQGFTGGQG